MKFLEEFGKIKEEVPPLLSEAHTKNVAAMSKNASEVDARVGLSSSGIAMATDDDKTTTTVSGNIKYDFEANTDCVAVY